MAIAVERKERKYLLTLQAINECVWGSSYNSLQECKKVIVKLSSSEKKRKKQRADKRMQM